MRRSGRLAATVVAVAVVVASGTLAAGAAVATKGSRIKLNDACTMLTTSQVAKAFGGPAHPKMPLLNRACNFPVGVDPNQLPGGTLTTEQLFPTLLVPATDAVAAIEDSHAIDTLSGDELADVNHLGLSAYIDYTKGVLRVATKKRYAFSITWAPASVTQAKITHREGNQLIKLAKDVVKRAPR